MNFTIRRRASILLLGITVSFEAGAQTGLSCEAVYKDSVSKVSVTDRQEAQRDFIFDNHCEKSGELKSSQTSVDLTIPVKELEIGFNGSHQEAEQRMKNFCKSHLQTRTFSGSFYTYNRQPVVDAMRSYNECKFYANTGVFVSHQIQEPRSLIIRVDFDPTLHNVVLHGATYDASDGQCYLTGKNKVLTPQFESRDMDSSFTITCNRKAKLTKAKIKKYDRFTVGVAMNQSSYSVALPTEGVLGFDLASINKQRFDSVVQQRTKLQVENDFLKKRINGFSTEIHLLAQRDSAPMPPPWETVGCPPLNDPRDYAKTVCGNRPIHFQPTGVTYDDGSGSSCGLTLYAFSCNSL